MTTESDLQTALEDNRLLIAENRRLKDALKLISDSDSFNGGTFVSELQGIAKRALNNASCDCTLYNSKQCFNCLNGSHHLCGDGKNNCNMTRAKHGSQS